MNANDNVRILKDRLACAELAYLNSKTEEEITSLRGVIKFLQCRIRKLQAPPILEEALD